MRYISIFLFVLFFAKFTFSQTSTPPTHDNQFWNETQLVVWSDKKNEVTINGVLRVGRNFSHFVDERIGFSYTHKPAKILTLTGSYLYKASQPYAGRKSYEHRIFGSGTFNFDLGNKFILKDRNQLEYKMNNSRPNVWEYRNRARLEREISIGKTKITPFGYIEGFYNITRKDWYRIRFAAGIGKKFTHKFSGEIFYLRQTDDVSRPGNLNVLGTSLKIHL